MKRKDPREKPLNFNRDTAWKELWNIFLETFLNSKELAKEIEAE
jgi:hypothetical protein